ncbi:MAG: SPOR domain-containing protein [Pseudomonadota bacterium]
MDARKGTVAMAHSSDHDNRDNQDPRRFDPRFDPQAFGAAPAGQASPHGHLPLGHGQPAPHEPQFDPRTGQSAPVSHPHHGAGDHPLSAHQAAFPPQGGAALHDPRGAPNAQTAQPQQQAPQYTQSPFPAPAQEPAYHMPQRPLDQAPLAPQAAYDAQDDEPTRQPRIQAGYAGQEMGHPGLAQPHAPADQGSAPSSAAEGLSNLERLAELRRQVERAGTGRPGLSSGGVAAPHAQQGFGGQSADHGGVGGAFDPHAAQPHQAPPSPNAAPQFGAASAADPATGVPQGQRYAPAGYNVADAVADGGYRQAASHLPAASHLQTGAPSGQAPASYSYADQGYGAAPGQAGHAAPGHPQSDPALYNFGNYDADRVPAFTHDPQAYDPNAARAPDAGHDPHGFGQAPQLDPTTAPPHTHVGHAGLAGHSGLGSHPNEGAHAPHDEHFDAPQWQHESAPVQPAFTDPSAFNDPHYGQDPQDPYAQPGGQALVHDEQAPDGGGRKRGLLIAAAVAGAVVIGSGLAYGFSFLGDGKTGKPLNIQADGRPVKQKPRDPGGRQFANPDKKFNQRLGDGSARQVRVASANGVPPSAEREIASTPRRVATIPISPRGARPTPPAQADQPTTSSPDAPLVVPGVSIDQVLAPQRGAAKPPRAQQLPAAQPLTPQNVRPRRLPAQPVRQLTPQRVQPPRTVPRAKPIDTATLRPRAQPKPPARTRTRPAPRVPAGGANGYVAWVASSKDKLRALAQFANMQQRYGAVMAGRQPDIQEADLGSRGKWYRLRIGPPGSRAATASLCQKLIGKGVKSCFVRAY